MKIFSLLRKQNQTDGSCRIGKRTPHTVVDFEIT